MNKVIGYIVILLFVFIVIYTTVRRYNLKTEYLIGQGVIVKAAGKGGKSAGGFNVDFYLSLDGKRYKGSNLYGFDQINAPMINRFFIGKQFPVAYYKNNPHNNQVLILETDFQKFNLPYPDSLNWVKGLTKMKAREWKLLDSNFMDKDSVFFHK